MAANTAPSTLLDGGYFVVSYDLPLENAYAILPVLKGPTSQGEPALLESRASTDLERTNRYVYSNESTTGLLYFSVPCLSLLPLKF